MGPARRPVAPKAGLDFTGDADRLADPVTLPFIIRRADPLDQKPLPFARKKARLVGHHQHFAGMGKRHAASIWHRIGDVTRWDAGEYLQRNLISWWRDDRRSPLGLNHPKIGAHARTSAGSGRTSCGQLRRIASPKSDMRSLPP